MNHRFENKKKYMTSHRMTFDIYEVNAPHNVYLGDDSVVEAIGIVFIIVEVLVREKNQENSYEGCLPCAQVACKFAVVRIFCQIS